MTCSTNIITGTQGSAINSFTCSSNYPVSNWIINGSLPNGLYTQKSTKTLSIQGTPYSSFNSDISVYFTTPYANSSIANITLNIQPLTEVVFNFDDGIIPSGWNLETPSSNWFFRIISTGCYSGNCLSSYTGQANPDSVYSYLTYSTVVPVKAYISYQWRVSSESSFDNCKFYINGAEKTRISGISGDSMVTYLEFKYEVEPNQPPPVGIAPTPHVFKWEYHKDGSITRGQDACWLDEVKFTYLNP